MVDGRCQAPVALPQETDPVTMHRVVGLGPVWIGAENLTPTMVRTPDGPGRSESLYKNINGTHVYRSVKFLTCDFVVVVVVVVVLVVVIDKQTIRN